MLFRSSDGEGRFRALLEKIDGDDRVRDYRLIKARTSGGLEKQIDPAFADGYGLVGVVAGGGDVGAVLERTSTPPRRWTIVATAQSGTMQKELAGKNGYRIVNGSGDGEAVYGLVEEHGGGDYLVLSTTKTETLEKELNGAVQNGYRVVAGSLLGMQKRFLGKPVANEVFVVMERRADAAPVPYTVLGTLLASTFQRELAEATAKGSVPISVDVSFREILVILENTQSAK